MAILQGIVTVMPSTSAIVTRRATLRVALLLGRSLSTKVQGDLFRILGTSYGKPGDPPWNQPRPGAMLGGVYCDVHTGYCGTEVCVDRGGRSTEWDGGGCGNG
ncbi:hypothetical protein IW261DRAFT_1057543 [Armillaria novae-zelandiae]|uniref:Uncharacterized protein n=1 Tax=Armillaria novae-zelandiae TaxID=153914 RepID=A0AA39NL55_9AGAR|nr:hypothetical protein IW261DRAFT_1057543 [Armillaria novae-zelandiae]